MVDELAKEGVAGRLLRVVGNFIVVDKRACPGAERQTDDGAYRRRELDGPAHVLGWFRRSVRRGAAAADSALGSAGLVAEPEERRILGGSSGVLRALDERRATSMTDAHRWEDPQHPFEFRLGNR